MKSGNNTIKILDCTLRDGGYINNWQFPDEGIIAIINSLIKANIDIIECGFISQREGKDNNSSMFKSFSQINNIIKPVMEISGAVDFCVMINKGEFNIDTLPEFNPAQDQVSMVRYAYHKKDWKEAIRDIGVIIQKGYKVFVQAMVTLNYTDLELLQMIKRLNELDVYAVYIVDSFGSMFDDDFRRLHYLFDNNLCQGIRLGYHSHNNLQLAYSNAIDFIQIKDINREIIIDSSIHGMGRGAGNLTTELLADYLNKKKHASYDIIPLLEIIDKYIEVIYKENYWGYSIAHFLSASFGCHPNYASFLVNTKTLSIVDMQKILALLNTNEKQNFAKTKIEELYIAYKSQSGISETLQPDFFKGKRFMIIASGPNSELQKNRILSKINDDKPITVISVNHIQKNIPSDYLFFSNQKRFDRFREKFQEEKIIITSNIQSDDSLKNFKIVDYHDLVIMTRDKNDNVTILLLGLLIKQGIKEVLIAGMDGYKYSGTNYSYKEFDRLVDEKEIIEKNKQLQSALDELKKSIKIHFITDTLFK